MDREKGSRRERVRLLRAPKKRAGAPKATHKYLKFICTSAPIEAFKPSQQRA